MVFVMILIRINSSGTSASCAVGVICFSIYYWQRIPLRDKDRLGFLSCCSWMLPEQIRNKSEIVDSEDIHRVSTKHPKCVTPSGEILWKVL